MDQCIDKKKIFAWTRYGKVALQFKRLGAMAINDHGQNECFSK